MFGSLRMFLLFGLGCFGCVPLQQQISESHETEIDGLELPFVLDKAEFKRVLLLNNDIAPNGEFSGAIPITNCECIDPPRIVNDDLIVRYTLGGGSLDSDKAILYWDGQYHRNKKGEFVVDLILHSEVAAVHRPVVSRYKIHNIALLKRKDVTTVWINLVGYEQLIKYEFKN